MNRARVTPGVIDPEPDPDEDDESETNSSTSSFESSCTPSRSSEITSGENVEADPVAIGELVNSVGPAVGECSAESVCCLVLVDLSNTFSLNWLSGVGATSSIYCWRSDQHLASSVRPAIKATCSLASASPRNKTTYTAIPGTQLFRRLTFNLIVIGQIREFVVIEYRQRQKSKSL